jgi:hypothetical protein
MTNSTRRLAPEAFGCLSYASSLLWLGGEGAYRSINYLEEGSV